VIVSGLPRPGCDSANEEQVGEKRTAPARSLRRGRVWARVRRPLLALAQVPLVVVVAVGAAGCRHAETATPTGASSAGRIVVDRSIGPISIGIARQRVVRLLGPPDTSIAVRSTTREPGTLARYGSHGADLSIVYDSRGRVASIETYSPRYRTSTGVGPGAPLARGSRLPGFRRNSCDLGYWNAGGRTGRRAVVTVFTPNGGLVDSVLITQLRFDTNCAQAGRGLEPRPNVVLDRSIGGVSLGMIERTVVKRLGDPVTTRRARSGDSHGTSLRERRFSSPMTPPDTSCRFAPSRGSFSPRQGSDRDRRGRSSRHCAGSPEIRARSASGTGRRVARPLARSRSSRYATVSSRAS
jgi:hypothetical protein